MKAFASLDDVLRTLLVYRENSTHTPVGEDVASPTPMRQVAVQGPNEIIGAALVGIGEGWVEELVVRRVELENGEHVVRTRILPTSRGLRAIDAYQRRQATQNSKSNSPRDGE